MLLNLSGVVLLGAHDLLVILGDLVEPLLHAVHLCGRRLPADGGPVRGAAGGVAGRRPGRLFVS